jgi:predicted  nucleic acid-binding Zn-ribbon protein
MDATAELTGTPTREDYTSRPGALIWFFRKSRDRWKRKYQDLKATVKGFKNQIAAVTKSREQWRVKAEQASERVSALESEIKELHAQAAAWLEKKRSGPGKRPAESQPV